jgi:hypothetical protein
MYHCSFKKVPFEIDDRRCPAIDLCINYVFYVDVLLPLHVKQFCPSRVCIFTCWREYFSLQDNILYKLNNDPSGRYVFLSLYFTIFHRLKSLYAVLKSWTKTMTIRPTVKRPKFDILFGETIFFLQNLFRWPPLNFFGGVSKILFYGKMKWKIRFSNCKVAKKALFCRCRT